MDDAANVQATPKGRLMRNLIDGAEFLHSHVLHFYHLCLQDYIDMSSLGMSLGAFIRRRPEGYRGKSNKL